MKKHDDKIMKIKLNPLVVAGLVLSTLALWAYSGHVPSAVIASGPSMLPTVSTGDLLVIKSHDYEVGDVVVYKARKEDPVSGLLCKRVAAASGDHVKVSPDGVFINEAFIEESGSGFSSFDAVLSEEEVFLLGDNPKESYDSRMTGPLASSGILGKATVIKAP